MNKKISLIILLFAAFLDLFAQQEPPQKQSILLFSAGYRIPVNKSTIINSGHGIYLEAGINPGKLLLKNSIIGLYGGVGFKDRFWNTNFTDNFTRDFASSINTERTYSQPDCTIVYTSRDLFKTVKGTDANMPGCRSQSFHNYSLYYGVIVKLPYRWMPGIKIYHGKIKTHYQGDGNLVTKNKEYNIFELERKMWGAEILLSKTVSTSKKGRSMLLGASIYLENCNFSAASINFTDGTVTRKLFVKDFMQPAFITKYNNEVYWGIKLFFCIS